MDSPPSEDQFKQDQSRAKWSAPLDKILLDLLIEQTGQNKMSNKKAWKHIREEFNYKTGLQFDGEQLRNHQNVLKRLYNNIKSVLDQSGFSWDNSRNMVMADDELWEKYTTVCPLHISSQVNFHDIVIAMTNIACVILLAGTS